MSIYVMKDRANQATGSHPLGRLGAASGRSAPRLGTTAARHPKVSNSASAKRCPAQLRNRPFRPILSTALSASRSPVRASKPCRDPLPAAAHVYNGLGRRSSTGRHLASGDGLLAAAGVAEVEAGLARVEATSVRTPRSTGGRSVPKQLVDEPATEWADERTFHVRVVPRRPGTVSRSTVTRRHEVVGQRLDSGGFGRSAASQAAE